MTITRRPPRPNAPTAAPLAPRRRKTAESFIEDAHHQAAAAEAPATVPAPAPPPEPTDEDAKPAKKKGKGKDEKKSKGKHKAVKAEKAKRKDKEAVLIRFEDEQLSEMDQRAAALGLSRAAWLRMVVSKALRGKKA